MVLQCLSAWKFCLAGEAALATVINTAYVQDFFIDDVLMSARRLRLYDTHLLPISQKFCLAGEASHAALLHGSERSYVFLYARTLVCVVRPERRRIEPALLSLAFFLTDFLKILPGRRRGHPRYSTTQPP
ncbi:hypothetical protein BDZ89DRAFT_530697 [Hymenopellis radicata]|nr:hypothetical protein BDZ89DRAFT_530697 [Hymenopellis radicata]